MLESWRAGFVVYILFTLSLRGTTSSAEPERPKYLRSQGRALFDTFFDGNVHPKPNLKDYIKENHEQSNNNRITAVERKDVGLNLISPQEENTLTFAESMKRVSQDNKRTTAIKMSSSPRPNTSESRPTIPVGLHVIQIESVLQPTRAMNSKNSTEFDEPRRRIKEIKTSNFWFRETPDFAEVKSALGNLKFHVVDKVAQLGRKLSKYAGDLKERSRIGKRIRRQAQVRTASLHQKPRMGYRNDDHVYTQLKRFNKNETIKNGYLNINNPKGS